MNGAHLYDRNRDCCYGEGCGGEDRCQDRDFESPAQWIGRFRASSRIVAGPQAELEASIGFIKGDSTKGCPHSFPHAHPRMLHFYSDCRIPCRLGWSVSSARRGVDQLGC